MLKNVVLNNFRNYTSREFDFEKGVNVICGDNAKGKTNILEALYLISTGESFRARKIEEMVFFGEELGSVKGNIVVGSDDEPQEIVVIVNGGVVMGKKVNKRKYLINGVSKRRVDLVGIMPVVIFRPEDVELITGSSEVRRRFVDGLLCQIEVQYQSSLSTYEQALKRRNKVLDAIRDGLSNRYALTFWDNLLIKHGNYITEKRRGLIDYINDLFERSELFRKIKISYDFSAISESRLSQYKEAEVAVGYTLVGPHKDDFIVFDNDRNLSSFGSRGEQRMAVLAMKMGEIYYLEEKSKKNVLLLLDDIFSELDEVHKNEVLRVTEKRQVVVTTADKSDAALFKECKQILLN